VNLLLFERPEPLAIGDRLEVTDRQAEHLRSVLRVVPGRRLVAGALDAPDLWEVEVTRLAADAVEVRVAARAAYRGERPEDAVVLAVPRPKVLRRMLASAAALGFGAIHLTRSWRVEKAHLDSRVLGPEAMHDALIRGLEQGMRTFLPTVRLHRTFRGFVDAALPDLPARRFVAHPGAPAGRASSPAAIALAVGPDGGWIERELATLVDCGGFEQLALGPHPLRTEDALPALKAVLDRDRQRP